MIIRGLDVALDRSLLGYTRLGPLLRRAWWPADPAPGALAGQRVLVTGATGGLGASIARGAAELGAIVHLMGRNDKKVRAGADDLRSEVAGAEVVPEVLDLGDLDAVRRWAEDFTGRVDSLAGLVHNAGVMTPERQESAQGHELGLSVHVLAPHLMTHLLAEPLRAGRAEVVWMSSGGMYGAGLRAEPDAMEFRDGTWSGVRAYARTKRMQVVLAAQWARAGAAADVRVESMHPGWAGTAGLTEQLPGFDRLLGPVLRDADSGADTAVWLLATRPDSRADHFWHDRAQRPSTIGWQRATDPTLVTRFVDQVEQLTGVPVSFDPVTRVPSIAGPGSTSGSDGVS